NMVTSEGLLEGPVGLGDASWTFGARRSYFDLIFGRLFADTVTLFPRFWDLGGSVDAGLSAHDRVRVIGLATDDRLGLLIRPGRTSNTEFAGDIHYRNTYQTGGATWTNTRLPGLRFVTTPYAYNYLYDAGFGGFLGIKWETQVQGVKEDVAWEAGTLGPTAHTLELGGAVELEHDTSYVFANVPAEGRRVGINFTSTVSGRGFNTGGYVQDRVTLGRNLTIAAGGRHDRSEFTKQGTWTPRASLEWRADPATTVRAAAGTYSQFPKGWQVNKDFGNPNLKPSFADHAVAGIERRLARGLFARVEAYTKRYRDQIADGDDMTRFTNDMSGDARGVEVLLKENLGERFFGWISYARSRSRRR
ncbi:MAG: TonB-dependent receptor, partial [bacterium]